MIPRTRRASGVVAVVLVVAATMLLPSGSWAVTDSVAAARQQVAAATRAREQAEARLVEVATRRDRLVERAGLLDAADAQSAAGLAEAHRQVRELAVAAYIDGGRTEILQATLDPVEASAVAWRVGMVTGGAGRVSEAMDRYDRLRSANDPEQQTVALELDRATAEQEQARSDVVQTSAQERDAAAALDRAIAVRDRAAAERAAAERAAARARTDAAKAAATSSGRPSRPAGAAAMSSSSSAAGLGTAPRVGGATAEEAAFLARVRACESGGNYSIVSSTGRYRGAYQFSVQTWRGVGGSGDPAAASPAEQDARALALLRLQGKRAWPVCSRR